jgi:hypothetical protein
VTAILLIFGAPMLISEAMINPEGLHLRGLITYTAVMLIVMPFAGWQLLLTQFVLPTAGRSRLGAVASLWFGGTLVGVAVIFWLYSVLSYPRPGARIDPMGHLLIPFAQDRDRDWPFRALHARVDRMLGRGGSNPAPRGCHSGRVDHRMRAVRGRLHRWLPSGR